MSKKLVENSLLIIILLCFSICLFTYYPGWMSPDSFAQYADARAGIFYDWHPVIMAWWWRLLLPIYDGPLPILFQNLIFYWSGWFFLARWAQVRIGQLGLFIPMLGLWPGVSFPLGQIWKDIFFAAPLFFSWAFLLYLSDKRENLTWFQRFILFFSITLGVGAKTNGVVVVPFITLYWLMVEWRNHKVSYRRYIFSITGIFVGIVAIPQLIVALLPVQHTYPFQYTQVYDLLAISVETDENLLPRYIKRKFGSSIEDIKELYFVSGNNLMFYGVHGNIATADKEELRELNDIWIKSIVKNPYPYLKHRLNNFYSLIRVNEIHAFHVAAPVMAPNTFGFETRETPIGTILSSSLILAPWMYFPWVYLVITVLSVCLLFIFRKDYMQGLLIAASSVTFIIPHFFIAPAADYRYLYYSSLCALLLLVMAVSNAVKFCFCQKG